MKLSTFFEEKNLEDITWELEDSTGITHSISNATVIDFLLKNKDFAIKASPTIYKLDRLNGDLNHFLKHIAGFIINI